MKGAIMQLNISSLAYEQQFRIVWRKRFRDYLKAPADKIEHLINAQWARYESGEEPHWYSEDYGIDWEKISKNESECSENESIQLSQWRDWVKANSTGA
jgi:hypothetical protein